MKAMVYREYGSPDVLALEEVDKPTPKADEVLVKVHASSINDWDWGLLRGQPYVNRLPGLRTPTNPILGCDVAGQVEAVGEKVTRFHSGDEVFGDLSGSGFGCYAEYVCARENALTLKPASLTFEQAAAVPQAGVLATLGLRRRGEIQPGQNVLVNGAGGGAGSFAVQIAKAFEAEVTGVDNTVKQDMMTSIGADHAIDYTKEDFTWNGQRYDYILDNAAHHSIFAYRCSLASGGTYVMLGGSMGRILQGAVVGPIMSLIGSKKLGLLMLRANRDLDFLMELIETGKVEPVIDKTYPLSELAEAFRRFGKGHALGKLVITV